MTNSNDDQESLPQLSIVGFSGGVPANGLVGFGVELEEKEGISLQKAISAVFIKKTKFSKGIEDKILSIDAAVLRGKKAKGYTIDSFAFKLRYKNGNSDRFVLATLSKRKVKSINGKETHIKPSWNLNLWCNPTHLVTRSKELQVINRNGGHDLSFAGVIRVQIIGFLYFFSALEDFGFNWQPSPDTLKRINAGEVYFHALEVASRSSPIKTRHLLQAERILSNVLLAADASRTPKKGAVNNQYRTIAAALGISVTPLLKKSRDGGATPIKGLSIAVQSNKGNRSLDATIIIRNAPYDSNAGGGRCFVTTTKITREFFSKIPAIKERLEKEDRALMLKDVTALAATDDGGFELLSENQATQRTFFEMLQQVRRLLLEDRLRLSTLVWVEEGSWQRPLQELAKETEFSSILEFWRDDKQPSKEELAEMGGSRTTRFRRLKKMKERGLDLSLPHWAYVLREEAVTASFASERQRTWAATNRGERLPRGMRQSAEANRKRFFGAAEGLAASLHKLTVEDAQLPVFGIGKPEKKK